MFKRLFISVVLIITTITNLYSQNEQVKAIPLSLGLYAGVNLNMHSPSFKYNGFFFDENATGIGGVLGFTAMLPVNNVLVLSGKIGYNGLGGILTKDDIELDASLNYIEISPEAHFHNIIPIENTYLIGGLETGIPLSPRYTISGDTSINIENETVSDASFRLAGVLGLGYFLEVSEGVNLTPELTIRFPFSSVSSNDNFKEWEIPAIRLSIGLTFSMEKLPEPIQEEVHSLNLGFKEVRYYDNEGNFYPLERIRVEDTKYTEQFPIIPYVFFDENKRVPSNEMQSLNAKTQAGEFSIQNLSPDALQINKSLLDLVGRRLQQYENSELTITGTLDNLNEKGNTGLSFDRAKFAKDYIVNNYNIINERINVRGLEFPEKPSTVNDSDGVAENRRIELSSSNPKILEPITIQKENQTIAEPNLVEFVPYIESTDSILEWKLSISQKGQEVRSFAGISEPGYIAWVIIPNELVKSELPIEYVLWAKNEVGIEKTAAGTIPVDYYSFSRKKTEDLADKTIAKFSLILFDFDSDKISNKDLDVINKDILPLIKFNSTINIYGYTDRIGNDNYNKSLSMRRAEAVKSYLKSKVKSAKYKVYGVGENELLYDNDIPIGRQLSRTVQIHIYTPR